LRRVAIREGIPFSIRSSIKGEIPARLANSVLLSIFVSRTFRTLLLSIVKSAQFFSGSFRAKVFDTDRAAVF
jgi:hypothetical protein